MPRSNIWREPSRFNRAAKFRLTILATALSIACMSHDFRLQLTRRAALAGAGAALAGAAGAVARENLIPFGAAVMISDFRADERLRRELAAQCDIIVPMNELKWEALRHARDGYDFRDAEEILAFARRAGKASHGHALLWGEALPGWVKQVREPRLLERELIAHIETVCARMAGQVVAWDVCERGHRP